MKISSAQWPLLDSASLKNLMQATQKLHVAAQLLAMAGKYFLPHQADDSHTNMGWDSEQEYLIGHPLPTSVSLRLALHPASMKLQIVHAQNQVVEELGLGGKTLAEAVAWVRRELTGHWFDTRAYRIDLHYDLPDYPLLAGGTFESPAGDGYIAFNKVRELGHQVMETYAAEFEYASPVRTWPHHFDIGTYVPIRLDAQGEVFNSLTLGLAIADNMVNDYYFYVTHWTRSGTYSPEPLALLPGEGYWGLGEGTGAILRLRDVSKHNSAEEQIASITEFMDAAIRSSLQRLGEVQ